MALRSVVGNRPAGARARPPIIYFNIGWMKHYAGPAPDDPTRGAHGYLGSHKHGAESFNFLATPDGMVHGYRPPGDRERVNLNRMGASSRDDLLAGALVVWMAREPGTGRTLIVGWYRNATVYRAARDGGVDLNGERIHYSVEASVADATLLPLPARTFEIRSSRVVPGGGFGQKPTWFGAEPVDRRVWDYVRSFDRMRSQPKRGRPGKPPRNTDPELRRKVERAAVEHAEAYYKSLYGEDCEIVSVESEGKGWDLQIGPGPAPLLVEVKGLLNQRLVCELTPNEYEKMMKRENRSRYVVFVVTNALANDGAVPVASVFEHAGQRCWRTADGRELVVKEKVGAVLSAA